MRLAENVKTLFLLPSNYASKNFIKKRELPSCFSKLLRGWYINPYKMLQIIAELINDLVVNLKRNLQVQNNYLVDYCWPHFLECECRTQLHDYTFEKTNYLIVYFTAFKCTAKEISTLRKNKMSSHYFNHYLKSKEIIENSNRQLIRQCVWNLKKCLKSSIKKLLTILTLTIIIVLYPF